MDGLSGAASVMGVISLAVQLGDSAFKIYKFLETVKDAPKEVVSLKDRVLQLHNILKGVQDLVKRQNAQGNVPPPPEYLFEALQTCKLKIQYLKGCVAKLQGNVDGRGLRWIWGALKIPFSKELVAKACLQIQEAVQALHLAISINNGMISLACEDRTEIVVSRVKVEKTIALAASTYSYPANTIALQGTRTKVIRETKRQHRTALGIYTSRTTWSQPLLDGFGNHNTADESPLNYRTTITFAPIFSSRILLWQTRSMYGHVERIFRTYNTHPEQFDGLWDSMVGFNESERPQELRRQLSKGFNPFVLDEDGESLLQWSLWYGSPEIARILIQIGVGVVSTSNCFGDLEMHDRPGKNYMATVASCRGQWRVREKALWTNHTLGIYQDSADQLIGFGIQSSLFEWGTLQFEDSADFGFSSIVRRWQEMSAVAGMEHWAIEERYAAMAFLMDILHTEEPLSQRDILVVGLWIFRSTIYAYDSGDAFSVWAHDVRRRGMEVEIICQGLFELLRGKDLRFFPNRDMRARLVIMDPGTVCWEWQHDKSEEAFELCQEFEDLLLHDAFITSYHRGLTDTWPYHCKWPYLFQRVPRRFRRQLARERAMMQRNEPSRGSMMPGTFPEDLGTDGLCNIHYQSLPCPICSKKESKDRLRVLLRDRTITQ